jgi:hypothetical protein
MARLEKTYGSKKKAQMISDITLNSQDPSCPKTLNLAQMNKYLGSSIEYCLSDEKPEETLNYTKSNYSKYPAKQAAIL